MIAREPASSVAKDGSAHLLTVEGDEKAGWSNLLAEMPDIVSRLANAVGDRVRLELSSRGLQTAQLSEQATDAKSAELPGKKD